MIHYLRLQEEPFKKIKSGKKDIELRLNDEKRRRMMAGDIIEFTSVKSGEKLSAIIVDKTVFPDFVSLFACFDKTRLGYEKDDDANPSDMEIYYYREEIEVFGAVAIELKVLNEEDLKEDNLHKLVAQYAPNTQVFGVNFLRLFHGNPFKGIKKFSINLKEGWFYARDNGRGTLIKQTKNSKELIDEFYKGLNEIDFNKWNKQYVSNEPSQDWDGWELEMRFFDGTNQIFSGTNAYPEDWHKLLNILGKYTTIFNNKQEV